MSEVLRIWSRSAPYRRAGLAFGSVDEHVEVDADALAPKMLAILAADDNLVIKGPDGQGGWEVMPAEVCALAVAQLATLDDQDWAEIAAEGSGAVSGREEPVQIDPGLLHFAAVGQAVEERLAICQDSLERYELWPVTSPADLLSDLLDALLDRTSVIDRLSDELAELQKTHTPSEEEPGGVGGDGAAPAGGEQSQGAAPETVGEAAQEGGGDPPPPPAAKGGKPAKSKAG